MHVLSSGSRALPHVVHVDAPPPRMVTAEHGAADTPVRLVWALPASELPADDVVWSGRLDAPLAGAFAFQAKDGLSWWQSGRVRRWAGPVVILLAAFLLLPAVLLLAIRRRRRLDEARLRFLNELAHDLRTPLTSLRLHADLLTQGRAKAEKREAYTARMAEEAARLSALLANLLDLSRLDRGRRAFTAEDVPVPALVEQAVGEFRAVHPGRQDDLTLEGPDVVVRADRSALARAVGNLLDNAGKFTEPGTGIRVRWRADDGGVAIVVADDGPGVPARERRRVFDRYARGRAAKRDGVPGTGMGLALVRELVEGMGGTVALLEASKGAAFEIRIGGRDA
jgi:signal transduction histidine kinase